MSPHALRTQMTRLQCPWCRTDYAKKEHLDRHVRTHTGIKPFECPSCGRAFNRRDSLARHERRHNRRDAAGNDARAPQPASSPVLSYSEPATGLPLPQGTIGDRQEVEAPITDIDGFDFESRLIWPDSEDLFQTLASFEDVTQFPFAQMPLPLPANPDPTTLSLTSSSPFDERCGVPSLSTDGEKAVLDLSQLVSTTSKRVTNEISTARIDSLFLDESLHMFFTRFNRGFPVLHRPTFIYKELIPPLLLNAIALGSLFLGQEHVAKGEALWRLAHTAVATSWKSLISHRGPYDACNGIQLVLTALLGQIYASQSSNPALRATSHIFHSLGFFWARHCGMQEIDGLNTADIPAADATEEEKSAKWRMWVAKEIQRRAILGHYILDGQIATASGSPTAVRHAANNVVLPTTEDAFQAESVDTWIISLQASHKQQLTFREIFEELFSNHNEIPPLPVQHTKLSLLVTLEGLQSLVSDLGPKDTRIIGLPPRTDIYRALAKIYDIIVHNVLQSVVDQKDILLRWHAVCLDANTDTQGLCRAICSKYSVKEAVFQTAPPGKQCLDLIAWTRTDAARKALLHAVAIIDMAEEQPQGYSQPIHLPSSLFSAAVIYCAFCITGSASLVLPRTPDWKELVLTGAEITTTPSAARLDLQQYLEGSFETSDGPWTSRKLLYELNSVQKLFRIISGQWSIACEMGAVVEQLATLCHKFSNMPEPVAT